MAKTDLRLHTLVLYVMTMALPELTELIEIAKNIHLFSHVYKTCKFLKFSRDETKWGGCQNKMGGAQSGGALCFCGE